MKRLFFFFLMAVGSLVAYGQSSTSDARAVACKAAVEKCCERTPLTTKISLLAGEAQFANHYLNRQEYAGSILGYEAELGRFFRNSEALTWKLTLAHTRAIHDDFDSDSGLSNAAETSHISARSYDIDYAVYYNWLVGERLQLKAGGSLNFYGDMLLGDANAINNAVSVNGQVQLRAAVGARYGWDFKKCGLDIYCNLSTPFLGLMIADNRYEDAVGTIVPSEFNVNEYNHIRFATPENLQGIDGELGVGLALKHFSISLSYEARNRWWHAYGLQNYRKNSFFKLGVTLNLLTRQHHKTSDRHF